MSNLPLKKSLATLHLKDSTHWKCVRMCETQSPELSLLSMSITESGCQLIPLRNTCTYMHILHSNTNLLDLILTLSSIKMQGEKQ